MKTHRRRARRVGHADLRALRKALVAAELTDDAARAAEEAAADELREGGWRVLQLLGPVSTWVVAERAGRIVADRSAATVAARVRQHLTERGHA